MADSKCGTIDTVRPVSYVSRIFSVIMGLFNKAFLNYEMKCESGEDVFSHWGECPIDILLNIFSKLNGRDLAVCFQVNKAWRSAVIYFCEHYQLWESLAINYIYDKGVGLKERSKDQSYKAMFYNSFLWNDISLVKCETSYHEKESIKRIHVLNDKLILVKRKKVVIVYHKNFEVVEIIEKNHNCVDYHQNNHLAITLVATTVKPKLACELNIVKIPDCCCSDSEDLHPLAKHNLWKIYESKCYFIDESFTIWQYRPSSPCDKHLRVVARYYGDRRSVYGMFVYNNEPYFYTADGRVFIADGKTREVNLVYRRALPSLSCELTLYYHDKITVIYGSKSVKSVWFMKDRDTGVGEFVCPNLTAAMRHGNFLLLGYHDGLLQIYRYSELDEFTNKPEIEFRVQYNEKTSSIRDIDVFEEEGTHTIFLLVGESVAKLYLTHPDIDPMLVF